MNKKTDGLRRPLPTEPTDQCAHKRREKLSKQIEEFLANGGEIEKVASEAWVYGKVYSPAFGSDF